MYTKKLQYAIQTINYNTKCVRYPDVRQNVIRYYFIFVIAIHMPQTTSNTERHDVLNTSSTICYLMSLCVSLILINYYINVIFLNYK